MKYQRLAHHLGMEEEEVLELVSLFVDITQKDLGKIRKSILDNAAPDAASAAHSIKGAAANLGFDHIADLATSMEQRAREGRLTGILPLVDQVAQLTAPLLKR